MLTKQYNAASKVMVPMIHQGMKQKWQNDPCKPKYILHMKEEVKLRHTLHIS